MSKGSSAPPGPDYSGAAQATAAGNLANLMWQTNANRVNQVTPWGSTTWSATPMPGSTQSSALPATTSSNAPTAPSGSWEGNGQDRYWVPNQSASASAPSAQQPGYSGPEMQQWSQTTTLNPQLQAALDNQIALQSGRSGLANSLQGQLSSNIGSGFNAPDPRNYIGSVPGVNMGFGMFGNYGVNPVNQNFGSGAQGINTNFNTGSQVNTNAPQFTDDLRQQGQKAAYDSATGLLMPKMQQDTTNLDSQLRLQGLQPGTEAYNNAMQNLQRTQGQVLSNAASQSVLTGNDMANRNYASALAGFGAGNQAQGQKFGQDLGTFGANNQALGQQWGQDLGAFGANNQGQNQAFNQALAGFGANQTALQNYNQAQSQAYAQALNNYQTQYGSDYTKYMMPLSTMNALLNGQQVSMPQMPGYSQAGYVGGPDYSGAAQATGQYNSGVAAQNSANDSAMFGMLGSLGSAFAGSNAGSAAIASLFSDARLKTNIQAVGITPGGHNWYSWDWKDGSGSSTGVIAQEAMMKDPTAVSMGSDGYLRVNYNKIK